MSAPAGEARAPVIYAEVPHFYAAVARADDPILRRVPVIVGGDPEKRGRVQSASPDALAQGIELDMPMVDALERCPGAQAVRTDMKRYRAVSRQLMGLVRGLEENLEVDGLSAAYMLPTAAPRRIEVLEERALEVCRSVREQLGLPLRVGIAPVKFLARLAAAEVEAEGVWRLAPEQEEAFLGGLSPARLPEVGPKTLAALRALGVRSVGDLLGLGEERIVRELGRHGRRILSFARGEDASPIRVARHAKSLSHASSLGAPSLDRVEIDRQLRRVCDEVERDLREQQLRAGRVAVQVHYGEVAGEGRGERKPESRSRKLVRPILGGAEVFAAAVKLLDRTEAGVRPVRRLGVTLGDLSPALTRDSQLDLFASKAER